MFFLDCPRHFPHVAHLCSWGVGVYVSPYSSVCVCAYLLEGGAWECIIQCVHQPPISREGVRGYVSPNAYINPQFQENGGQKSVVGPIGRDFLATQPVAAEPIAPEQLAIGRRVVSRENHGPQEQLATSYQVTAIYTST